MPAVAPPESQSLIPLGFHRFTLGNVEQVCVDLFPISTVRGTIFSGLVTFVRLHALADRLWLRANRLFPISIIRCLREVTRLKRKTSNQDQELFLVGSSAPPSGKCR